MLDDQVVVKVVIFTPELLALVGEWKDSGKHSVTCKEAKGREDGGMATLSDAMDPDLQAVAHHTDIQ